MDFWEVVKKRISVREYSDQQIDQEKLKKIVDAAHLAPTARGEELWEFIVVTDKKALEDLGDITDHGKFLKGAVAGIVVLAKDTKYYLEDGSAATENILLAAASLGIGSCWIAGDKKPYGA
ncbi:MAG: nitroreductase family protein, partial [Candidatus Omnitrophica bacterium]|nr:nitroreductase family protein [Candidatus Omnitrophota bacterium]